jgi:hypothetical protein
MKKEVGIVAIIFLILFPALALAGMVLLDQEGELGDVTGQKGITVSIPSLTITASAIEWGDGDGFGTYTTPGWLIYSGVKLPTIIMKNVTIDAATIGVGGTSGLVISATGNIITGSLSVASVILGSSDNSTTTALSHQVTITGLGVSFAPPSSGNTGGILISAH